MTKIDNLPVYTVTMDSDVYAISLVDDPAIEINYVALSKQKPMVPLRMSDEERHLVIGPVLVPDKPIYRNMYGEEFYVTFSKEAIEKMAYDYIKSGYNMQSFTLQHMEPVNEVYVVESWLKESEESDKSIALGFSDCPVGTWFITAKVNNVDLWKDIKDGKANGFSVEAMVDLTLQDEFKKINKEKLDNKMAKTQTEIKAENVEVNETFWDKLKSIIADAMGTTKEDEEVKDAVEEVADALDTTVNMEEEENPAEEKTPEEVADETVEKIEENNDTPEEEKEDLQAVIDRLEEEVKAKDAEIEELKKANQKMSKRPSTKPVQTKVTASTDKSPRDIIEGLYRGTYNFK